MSRKTVVNGSDGLSFLSSTVCRGIPMALDTKRTEVAFFVPQVFVLRV